MNTFADNAARAMLKCHQVMREEVSIDGVITLGTVETLTSEPSARPGGKSSGIGVIVWVRKTTAVQQNIRSGSKIIFQTGKTEVLSLIDDGDGLLGLTCESFKSNIRF